MLKSWRALAALALLSACSSGSHSAIPSVAPLRIAHLGKPHYFFTRGHFTAQTLHRAHASYYGTGILEYGGGPVDITPKAYLIFWGITGPTDTAHDPDGVAPYLTNFFAALPNSSWLNTVTQYYGTSTGSTQYVALPPAAFTGTYYDPVPPPSTTYTDAQVANEALKVANIVGYDANTNYVVVTPHHYTISGFNSSSSNGFCAYHNATTTTGSQLLSYTVFPYIPDAGTGCGLGSVTSPGTLDGVSIVSGHEEAETITDADAYNGWLDSSGQEIADKCAWMDLANTSFPNGRSYPTQPLFSNASKSCVQSYAAGPTPTPPPSTNAIANPSFETGRLRPWNTCRSQGKIPLAFTTTEKPYSGKYDAYAGTLANHKEPNGITSVCQLVTIPAGGQLIVWTRGVSNDKRRGVFQFVRLYSVSKTGALAKTLLTFNSNDKNWVKRTIDLSAYANRRYYLALGIQGKANAHGRVIGLFVDDVSLSE